MVNTLESLKSTELNNGLVPLIFSKETLVAKPILPLSIPHLEKIATYLKEQDSKPNSKAVILWDVDVDGIFSGLIAEKRVNKFFPNIETHNYINKDKSHGIKDGLIQYIKLHEITTLIIVDAGSNDVDEIKYLISLGVTVIVIDHHEITESLTDDKFILINCKTFEYGCEVSGTYLVNDAFNQLAKHVGKRPTKEFDEIAVLSIVADVCKRDTYNRNVLINYTIGKIEPSPFLKNIKKGYHLNNMSSLVSITSSINAILRKVGTQEMMRMFSKDSALVHTLFFSTKKMKADNNGIIFDILKKSTIYEFENLISVFIPEITDMNVKAYSSIVANKLTNKYKKLCIVLLPKCYSREESLKDFSYTYSVRDSIPRDSLTVFRELGLDANGHKPSFGGKLKGNVAHQLHLINNSLDGSDTSHSRYGQIIEGSDLVESLSMYRDHIQDIALWNSISLNEDKIGFKFNFKGTIINKNSLLELNYRGFNLISYDTTIEEEDTLICFPELNSSINLVTVKCESD